MPHLENKRETKSLPNIRSLFYQKRSPEDMTYEDMIKQNQYTFNDEIYNRPVLLSKMSKKEKEKVHLLIDMRLQEIEDSGLSRSQVSGVEGNFILC